jgi:hypothetical protein
MSFFYLATPYTSYEDGTQEAFLDACEQAALLIKAGIPVFCPIAHTHPIAVMGELDPYDHAIWLPADTPMMDAAEKGLIVCMLPGWDTSKGVNHEIEYFKKLGRPLYFMEPDELPRWHPTS